MAYLQSDDESSEEIAGVVDDEFSFVSENESPSSVERNGRRLVTTDESTATTTIATRITPEAVSALFGYFKSRTFPMNQTLPRKNSPYHQELDIIIYSFGLKRTQAVTCDIHLFNEANYHHLKKVQIVNGMFFLDTVNGKTAIDKLNSAL